MFESLSERIHQDEMRDGSDKSRRLYYAMIGLVSLVIIAGLVEASRLIQ